MIDYGLIAAADRSVAASYSQAARDEGLEAVESASADQTRRILSERGMPRIVMAWVDNGNGSSLPILREVQRASEGAGAPLVLASVARELRTTIGDLRESLGIVEVLPLRAGQQALRHAIRRALTANAATTTDLCPPPLVSDTPEPDEHLTALAALEAMDLLEYLAPEQQLEDLVARTAEALDVGAAVVSLSIEDTEWSYAHASPGRGRCELRDASRASAFCAHVVAHGQPISVLDARVHPAFSGHSLVSAGAVVTFAGTPLVSSDGDVLGALCILDSQPISRISARLDLLTRIAARFMAELEGRTKARSAAFEVVRLNDKLSVCQASLREAEQRVGELEVLLTRLDDGIVLMNAGREILFINDAAALVLGVAREAAARMSGDQVARALAGHIADEGAGSARARELAFAPPPFAAEIEVDGPRRGRLHWAAKAVALPGGPGELFVLSASRYPADHQVDSQSERGGALHAPASGLRSTRVVKKRR